MRIDEERERGPVRTGGTVRDPEKQRADRKLVGRVEVGRGGRRGRRGRGDGVGGEEGAANGREGSERTKLSYVQESNVAGYPRVRIPDCKRSENTEREVR